MVTPNEINLRQYQPVFERYGDYQQPEFYEFQDELSEQFYGVLGQSLFVEVCYVDGKYQVEVGNLKDFNHTMHEFTDDMRADGHFYLFESQPEAMTMVSELLMATLK